jgi:serine/threonine protein kinase/Tfp pilus assembly protein PilF
MPLSTGTRLGTYKILGLLGAGGMGEVYRARDLRLHRDIALKVLPRELANDPDRVARFEREARTVAGLNHPNIVVLFSVDDEDGVRFITMELVEGASLDEHIPAGGLPLARVLDVGIALSDALTAAHERGVVHRDLKPANVMLTPDGRVKVLDFGLAKFVRDESQLMGTRDESREAALSTMGQVAGTVPYMAPEQIQGGAVDTRTDLFALGILLYELAAGRRPFGGATSVGVSYSILHDTPSSLGSVRTDLPGEFERIVGRCLQKDPRERVQTALDVGNELRRVRQALEAEEVWASSKTHNIASIAVLPFVNRSPNEDDEYFSDGLADELLNVLAKIRGFRVAARTSSFQFKGTKDDLATIGHKLNVAALLEGSVRKAGNRVRISVQLVKVSDGYHLWSETYDRTLDDIFAVQDDIAQSVVKELRATLLGEESDSDARGRAEAEVSKAAKGRATDPEAHRLYLLARHLMDHFTREESAKAIAYLERALKQDPNFPLAWAELSVAYVRQAGWNLVPAAECYRRGIEAVERSLALEPDLANGHAQSAWIKMFYDWDWRGAEVSLARARELAPGSASVLRLAGVLEAIQGRVEKAIALYRRALEQDPLSAAANHSLALGLHAADRFAEAEAAYRAALELAPQRIATRAHLALALLARGRGEEALAEAMREPEEGYRLWAVAIVHHALGHGAESGVALRQLVDGHADHWSVQIADVHAAHGGVDAAFAWLERAYAKRDVGLAHVRTSPRLRTLHGNPQWGAFLKKMGFEE